MNVEEYEKMYRFEEGCWWYKGRRELIMDIVAKIKLKSGADTLKILDVGCGTGLNLKYLERFGEASGLDMSKDALSFSRSRGRSTLIRANANDLPLRSGSFDVICALDLLEHIDTDEAVMREFYRVLRPSGYLVLTVPAFDFLWSGHDVALHHKRRDDKASLVKHLKFCGFFVDRSTYWNFFIFPVVAMVRTFRNSDNRETRTDLRKLPDLLNRALLSILRLENVGIRSGLYLPFGVSILCICRKG